MTFRYFNQERTAIIRIMREYHDPMTPADVLALLKDTMNTNIEHNQMQALLGNMVKGGSPVRRVSRGVYQYHSELQDKMMATEKPAIQPLPLVRPPVEIVAEGVDLLVIKYKGIVWIAKPSK